MFSGDSLFRDYPTTTGLPGGSKKKWQEKSLPLLKSLPEDVFVYPGHFNGFYIKTISCGRKVMANFTVNNISVVGMAVVVPEINWKETILLNNLAKM